MSPLCPARNGPPPFVVQILRAPLSLNNAVAAYMAYAVHRARQEAAAASFAAREAAAHAAAHGTADAVPSSFVNRIPHCAGALLRPDALFGFVAVLLAASLAHNFFTVARFHRIRRQVFGSSPCPMAFRCCRGKKRHGRHGDIALGDDGAPVLDTAEALEAQKVEWHTKFEVLCRRMPSLLVAVGDLAFAMSFLGLYVMTTLLAQKEGKVELSVAYASIGTLVAFLLNFILGVNGVKLWVRQRRAIKEERLEIGGNPDLKQPLL